MIFERAGLAAVDAKQVGSGLFHGDTALQAAHAGKIERAGLGHVRRQRHPHFRARLARQDANHRVRTFIQLEDASQHAAISLEEPLPQVIAQQDDRVAAGPVLLRQDVTADHRLQP